MIIDATDLIVGRIATVAAKKALQGEKVQIVNSGKAVITGDKKRILAKYKRTRERGAPLVGPFFPRQSDRFVKRTIRGMLPYKQPKGRDAFKRVLCYKGVPKELQQKETQTIKEANVDKLSNTKFIRVEDVCTFLGGK